MPPTQLRGSQILDGSITADDVDDALEKELTKVRVTTDDASADFLSSKVVPGAGISVSVVGASGSNQTLRISATGTGGGGGSSLTISGALGSVPYSDVPSKLIFDNGTGFQVQDLGSGTAKVTIASHYKNIFVSGSSTLVATGSDSLQVQGDGGIQVFTYIDEAGYASGSILAPKVLLIAATALSQSLSSRISNITSTITPATYVQSGTTFNQTTVIGSSNQYARADHQHGTPPSPVSGQFMSGMFGDGSDGDVTIAAGTTVLSREMHYNNLTLATGATLKSAGNRIFVNGTLTFSDASSINDNGNAGSGANGGVGLAARGYLGATGGAGGAGWSVVALNQANGNAGASSGGSSSLNNSNIAPTGGAGGNSTTRTGGAGGTAAQPTPSQKWSGRWYDGRASSGAFNGGSGGGGGALTVTAYTSGTFISGGGGSGGGIVWVAARYIVGGGIGFSANGGKGANGSVGVGTGTCGGGGGGGGGDVAVICKSYTGSVTLSVAGGGGGTGAATSGLTAGNGADGQGGNSILVVLG